MSDVPPDLQELYAQVGIACEIAQVVEVEAGNLALAYLTLFVKPGQEVTPAVSSSLTGLKHNWPTPMIIRFAVPKRR